MASSWSISVAGAATQYLSEDPLGTDLEVGLGLRRTLRPGTALTLEVAYVGLGSSTRSGETLTFPDLAPATFSARRARHLWRLGLTTDLTLTKGRFAPVISVGLHASRFYSAYRYLVTDTTGAPARGTDLGSWATGLGVHFGAGLRLPLHLASLRPTITARVYGMGLRSEGAWTGIPFATIGLVFSR